MKSRKPYANSNPRRSATLDALRRVEEAAKRSANDAARRRRRTSQDEAPADGDPNFTDNAGEQIPRPKPRR